MPVYLSKKALEECKKELENRRTILRREIANKIEVAKDLGDLSENFEYHEAMEQRAFNDARIVQLQDMLKDAVIVEEKIGGDLISVGCTFEAEAGDKRKIYQIVGSTEADPLAGKISNESPLGQAFLGHRVGETVEIVVPSGRILYVVIAIK
ncbi:MAG TPA: transcription elongation factor GreA [Patescibacteria group bacterium]|nr:transcription elongation factor GreA [Patescibacteria group bacterium]